MAPISNEHTRLPPDAARYRHVLGHYPTGVCVVTARGEGSVPLALVVGSFTSVSLDPPLVAFFPGRQSTTWPRIEAVGRFCVNVLRSDQLDLCRRLSSRAPERLDDLSFRHSPNGSPLLDGVVAWIDCEVHATHEAGDHFIVLGLVGDLDVEQAGQPLVFLGGSFGDFVALGEPDRAA